MKAISLWQPWASLMAAGLKTIETRSWPTHYRGSLAIHAAKRPIGLEEKYLLDKCYIFDILDFPLGAIVAIVELVDCKPTGYIDPGTPEVEFGNFAPGRWAWFTKNPRMLPQPVPYRGQQGLFEIPLRYLEGR